jgi:hypothetical protein
LKFVAHHFLFCFILSTLNLTWYSREVWTEKQGSGKPDAQAPQEGEKQLPPPARADPDLGN